MTKRTMVTLLIVAAAAVGLFFWAKKRQMLAQAASVPGATVAPSQLAPQAIVAQSFADLLQWGSNWSAQWFKDRIVKQPDAVPYKPIPITSKPVSPATPAASTPAIVTTPGTYYA